MSDWSGLKKAADEAGLTGLKAPEAYEDDRHYTQAEQHSFSEPCKVLDRIDAALSEEKK